MAPVASDPRTEREIKLRPSPEFELSGLAGAVEGATVRPLPPLELVATYFDTSALTLARSGITVRHRRGEGPARWTVKLPAGSTDVVVVRRELDIEGPESTRPPEIGALLAAHLRGRRLVPVATIETVRHRVVVEDEAGAPLVEVAHDLVSATHGTRVLGAWEEVEVEAVDPDLGDDALAAVAKALKGIGCRRARPMPKLVRALGAEALGPPEVVVPVLPAHPRPHEALEHALARSVHQLLDHDPRVRLGGDPEDLHRFRVAIRRLRSDLRTFRRFLDPKLARRLGGELRWVADETNELRDLDVLRGWLVAAGAHLPAADGPGLAALVERCELQQAELRSRLAQVLGSTRYEELVGELVGLVQAPPPVGDRADDRAGRRLARQVARRWDALAAGMDELEAEETDAALHQARIAAKRCRAAAEAIAPLTGAATERFARSLAALQDALGAAHDAAVIEGWLRAAVGTPGAFVAGELAVLARADARREGERWPEAWATVQRRHRHVS